MIIIFGKPPKHLIPFFNGMNWFIVVVGTLMMVGLILLALHERGWL